MMRTIIGYGLIGVAVVVQALLVLALLWALGWSLFHGQLLTFLFYLTVGVAIVTIVGGFVTMLVSATATRLLR